MKRILRPLALSAVLASAAGAAQYVPGLVQAKMPGCTDRETPVASHPTASFVPGTLATTVDLYTPARNPYDGVSWSWAGNTTFAYAGQMFFEAGRVYRFAKYVDDTGYAIVGGVARLEHYGSGVPFVSGPWEPPETGWYDVDFRFGNGGGGAGAEGGVANGFRWNTNGVDSFTAETLTEEEGWHPFFDPGDATLLRAKRSDQGCFGASGFETDGNDLLVDVAFRGVPAAGASLDAFWGASDGGTAPSLWAASATVAADVAAGDSDQRVRLVGAAGARYVAFRLLGTLDGSTPLADWSVSFDLASAAPAFVLVCGDPGYTNLPFVVSAAAVGTGASSFGAALELAPTESFASGVRRVPLALSGLGSEVAVATGLPTNSVWYARVAATNNLGQSSASDPIGPLRTLLPGVPAAEIAPLYAGFSHTTWTVSTADLGVGAEGAALWLDVSKAGDFSDALSFGGVAAAAAPASAEIDATGLENGTVYAVRGRVVNDWGVEGLSAVSSATIREEPVEMREPGYVAGDDPGEMRLSIEADDLEPGATYSVVLSVDGSSVRSWPGLSATGVFESVWRGAPGSAHRAEFTVASSFDGRSWTRTYPFSFVVGARNVPLASASDIDGRIFRVGDRATVGDGTADAVLGDGIATLDGQTVSMVHPGFTLLKAADGTEYGFGVYEAPGGGGDVFLFDWTSGSPGWTAAPWTKLTDNSSRAYPNHADDVAMIRNVSGDNYRYLTLPADAISLGQLVVGMTRHFTLNHASGTTSELRFTRTDGKPPAIHLSRPDPASTSELQFRFGEYDRSDGGNVVRATFEGPEMAVDFCGESPASKAYARKGQIHFAVARSRFDLGEGQTLRVRNGSRTTANANDFIGIRGLTGSGIHGPGTVELDGANFNCQHKDPAPFVTFGRLRSVTGKGPFDAENNVSRFATRFNTIPAIPLEILSARCPTNLNAQSWLRNYWDNGAADAWLSPDVFLSGCNYEIVQNGAYAPGWDFWDATNVAEKATIRGHVGFYGPPAYGRDGHTNAEGVQQGRVTHHVRIDDLELADRWSTAQINGINFNRGAGTNDIRGTFRIGNWEEHIRRPAGVDPSDYNGTVYAIVPWMTVHCNDNNQGLADTDWGQEQTFPGVREADGCVRLLQSLANNGSQTLKDRGPNDNFYFSSKTGFWLEGSDRTLFSLVYSTQETPHYATGGNFYLDSSKGGHKLTVTSGAMAVIRQNKWLGQPADMTRNGTIVLQGEPAYLHVPSPGLNWPSSGEAGGGTDYNMCWVPIVAADDLVKGGAGSIGLAGDQRGIRGTLAVNGGEFWLGYPAYKRNGYLYTYGHPQRGWPMHGCATDCDFRIRAGAVLALASNGYRGVDSDGNEVDAPVVAWGAENRHLLVLERSGNADGGVYAADGVEGVFYEATLEDADGSAEWFERGTWGSSESPAEHVDDVHFAGPGVVKVQHDRCIRPTMLILR